MTVLSKEQIWERLNQEVSKTTSLVITPLLQAVSVFDSDSVDLRLGTHFLLPEVPPAPFFYPSKTSGLKYITTHIPVGRFLVVPAYQTVLGATLEFIKIPSDLSGQILTKSSVARTFVVIETAPWIHPGYRGCLTLEIANVSNTPLLLYPGRTVGQLILFKVSDPSTAQKQSGLYMGPVYPEPPSFLDPREELALLGIGGNAFHEPHIPKPTNDECAECLTKLTSDMIRCPFCNSEIKRYSD
jgi:dCTP deaminase